MAGKTSTRKNKNNISLACLSKAALGFFASTALILHPRNDGKASPGAIQNCDTLPVQVEDCYGNCYNGFDGKSEPLIMAEAEPWYPCVPENLTETPPVPEIYGYIEDNGEYNICGLYRALTYGRPHRYPYTWVWEHYGIPTEAIPCFPEGTVALIVEALRLGPGVGYEGDDASFLYNVKDKVEAGEYDDRGPDRIYICHWNSGQ